MVTTGFGDILADRFQSEHAVLAARWFERLRELLPVEMTEVFPSESLLDHIPALILDISSYLREPEAQAIAANTAVTDKARELGTLRHQQHASLHQLLREYRLLGQVLVSFVQEEIVRLNLTPSPTECVQVLSRLHEAVDVLMQETVETFVRLYTVTISDQAERLEQFTRMATHEWRQPLGSLQFAIRVLRQYAVDPVRVRSTVDVMDRSVAHLVDITHTLERLARMRGAADDAVVQEVSITTVAREAASQLREMAAAKDVRVDVADNLPVLTIDVGRLELALVNLLANAIKYSDSAKTDRFVEVVAGEDSSDQFCLVVRDNGVGIPKDRIGSIFERFSRAHADHDDFSDVTGLGLGLAIVADCVRTLGGTVDVESAEGMGTRFTVTVPRASETSSSPAMSVRTSLSTVPEYASEESPKAAEPTA